MSTLAETSLSILSQSNSPAPSWTFTGILLSTVFAVVVLCYVSPTRLTCVLVSALTEVENAYLAGVENDFVLAADTEIAERLAASQIKVSVLRETSLRKSLSIFSALYDTFNLYRSVAVLRCLTEVRGLGTYIEILNETQLREIASASESRCQCLLSNRAGIFCLRRDSPRSV